MLCAMLCEMARSHIAERDRRMAGTHHMVAHNSGQTGISSRIDYPQPERARGDPPQTRPKSHWTAVLKEYQVQGGSEPLRDDGEAQALGIPGQTGRYHRKIIKRNISRYNSRKNNFGNCYNEISRISTTFQFQFSPLKN